jgi:EAL domain-containing protein (putative c-di-GMP-specific phosphodiesterase class I)
LEIELTESCIMEDTQVSVTVLNQLKRMGITLSIDDFGTGYSSLSHLKRFPIDTLKIDRSFVQDIPHNPDDVAITTATIAMAKSLKLNVVAEGVQTEGQLRFLRKQGCQTMQGYLFSAPVSTEQITNYLHRGKRLLLN